MSINGQSLIDYALMPLDVVPLISNFVHEVFTCSTHAPIQLNFKVNYNLPEKADESFIIDKLIWDDSKLSTFRDRIFSEINSFNTIVDKTVSSEIDINQGVNNFAELLYTTTFSICGITKQCGGVNNRTPRCC